MGHIGSNVACEKASFIHDTAQLFGKVSIGENSSVFPYAVMRAEMHEIIIGARTNIQDFVMVHVGDFSSTIVGDDCSITHHVTLHGCEIGDRCLVGINATVMDGAKIGANSIIAGHTIVPQGAVFPENSVIAGVPAKLIDTKDNSKRTLMNSKFYQMIAKNYADGQERLSEEQITALIDTMAKK